MSDRVTKVTPRLEEALKACSRTELPDFDTSIPQITINVQHKSATWPPARDTSIPARRYRRLTLLWNFCKMMKDQPEEECKLDLREWGNQVRPDYRHPCGTPCCLVGWAVQHKAFQRLGLRFRPMEGQYAPVFLNHFSWTALERFFYISPVETKTIFHSDYFHRDPDWDTLMRRIAEVRDITVNAVYKRLIKKLDQEIEEENADV